MAFVSTPAPFARAHARRARVCAHPRMASAPEPPEPPAGGPPAGGMPPPPPPAAKKMPVTNSPATPGRKLVRSVDASAPPPAYADARPGDMVGAPEVGEGMGPRRGARDKKVTRAAAIQKSQSFADAWAEQNEGRVDVWLIIAALTLLTPIAILAWAVATGVIPTGGLFDG